MNTAILAASLTATAVLAAQPFASAADTAAASKADLKPQLAAQAQGEAAQGEAELFTTCYIAPFEVTVRPADYVCPVCGERTARVYAGYTGNAEGRGAPPDIDECRRLFADIPTKAGMKLDESEYCRKCSPRVRTPSPALLVTTARGQTRRVRHVTADDLRQLADYFAAPEATRQTLRKESARLRKLLGL